MKFDFFIKLTIILHLSKKGLYMKKFITYVTPIAMSALMSTSLACNKKVETIKEEYVPDTFKSDTFDIDEEVDFVETNYIPEEKEEEKEEKNILDSISSIECICTTGRVNIREGMSTESERITQVDKGYTLELLGEYDDWYQVKYLDKVGYVTKKYANRVVGYKSSDTMSSMIYVTESAPLINMYDPSEVLFDIPKNEICEVYGEIDNAYLVNCKGNYGFISKSNVSSLDNTYVIIDISTQTLRLYVDNELVLETFVVTGKDSTPTYCGFFRIREKSEHVHWPEFNVTVDYWMPFNRGEGMHDASWRKMFGSDLYKKDGSHGCVNIPVIYIKTIYDNVEVGTPVLVKK